MLAKFNSIFFDLDEDHKPTTSRFDAVKSILTEAFDTYRNRTDSVSGAGFRQFT